MAGNTVQYQNRFGKDNRASGANFLRVAATRRQSDRILKKEFLPAGQLGLFYDTYALIAHHCPIQSCLRGVANFRFQQALRQYIARAGREF